MNNKQFFNSEAQKQRDSWLYACGCGADGMKTMYATGTFDDVIRYKAPRFGSGYQLANGLKTFKTNAQAQSYTNRAVIVRQTGLNTAELPVGLRFFGKRYNGKGQTSVINMDGSDAQVYSNYIVGNINGKETWIHPTNAKDIGGGQFEINKQGVYGYKPEWWVDLAHTSSLFPQGQSVEGELVELKTIPAGSGYGNAEPVFYLKTSVNNQDVFIPSELLSELGRKGGSEEFIGTLNLGPKGPNKAEVSETAETAQTGTTGTQHVPGSALSVNTKKTIGLVIAGAVGLGITFLVIKSIINYNK